MNGDGMANTSSRVGHDYRAVCRHGIVGLRVVQNRCGRGGADSEDVSPFQDLLAEVLVVQSCVALGGRRFA